MRKDLMKAKQLLEESDATCVLCLGETVYTSRLRGVQPLLDFLDSATELQGFSAADKVVGKGAAFLYCLLGVRAVYAPVISKSAREVLERHGIVAECEMQADAILNRRRDGFCPMETAVKTLDDPAEALRAIRQTLKKIQRT